MLSSLDNGLFHFAKSASYSALLSLVPVSASVAAILVQVRAQSAENLLVGFLSHVLPPGAGTVVLDQFRASGQRPNGLLLTALLFSILAASNVITTLMDGFNAALCVHRQRSFFRESAVGILLVFLCAIPLVVASSLVLFGDAIGSWAFRLGGGLSAGSNPLPIDIYFSRGLHFAVALAATGGVTALLYRFGPNRTQTWRAIWPGAALATALWLLLTVLFAWYVRNIENSATTSLYGSVGASHGASPAWMYLLSAALLLGCDNRFSAPGWSGGSMRSSGINQIIDAVPVSECRLELGILGESAYSQASPISVL